MIETDIAKGIHNYRNFRLEKWDKSLKVEKEDAREESEEEDAKNRQSTSYNEVIEELLESLKPEKEGFEAEV